ncbi:MAG: site-specific integrase, partial [Sphingomonas sp.]
MTDAYLPRLFGQHLARDRRRSAHTVRAYEATAVRLTAFLGEHWGEAVDAAALGQVSGADIRAYLAMRRGQGLGNASAARELSALKALLGFARDKAGIADSAGPRLRGPRVKKGLPRPV